MAIGAQELDILEIPCTDLTLRHKPKTPALSSSIATCRFEFYLVFSPMLAQIVVVFDLIEYRHGTGGSCAVATEPNQHVWRVRMKSASIVLVQDLDWLLLETLDIGIEVQQ
jgi:hypothetical protein